jgi:hypothetical protein
MPKFDELEFAEKMSNPETRFDFMLDAIINYAEWRQCIKNVYIIAGMVHNMPVSIQTKIKQADDYIDALKAKIKEETFGDKAVYRVIQEQERALSGKG